MQTGVTLAENLVNVVDCEVSWGGCGADCKPIEEPWEKGQAATWPEKEKVVGGWQLRSGYNNYQIFRCFIFKCVL